MYKNNIDVQIHWVKENRQASVNNLCESRMVTSVNNLYESRVVTQSIVNQLALPVETSLFRARQNRFLFF